MTLNLAMPNPQDQNKKLHQLFPTTNTHTVSLSLLDHSHSTVSLFVCLLTLRVHTVTLSALHYTYWCDTGDTGDTGDMHDTVNTKVTV